MKNYIVCSAIYYDDGIERVHQPKNIKQIDIAKLFNVSPTNIRAIHRGLTWGYLA
jgi:hypothetical protein